MSDNGNSAEKSLGEVVNDVSTKASLLVREEIELAKAEISEKLSSIVKGGAVAAIAGVFAVFSLIYLFQAVAWFVNDLLNVHQAYWVGFLIVFAGLRYRRRNDALPSQTQYFVKLEILYTVVPVIIVAVLFAFSYRTQNEVDAL